MKEKLALLYALQQVDSALDAMKREFAALDRGQAEQARYDTVKAAHTEAHTALQQAEADQRDTELERQTVQAKHKKEETKLYSGKITAPKELQALTEEVEMLARQREKLDEKITPLAAALEAARAHEAETKKTLSQATAALRKKLVAYQETAETMQAQAKILSAQRNEAAKVIDAALLERYDALRASKGGIAITALIENNACGACRMGLPSDLIAKVRHSGLIVVCDNCMRMLYTTK